MSKEKLMLAQLILKSGHGLNIDLDNTPIYVQDLPAKAKAGDTAIVISEVDLYIHDGVKWSIVEDDAFEIDLEGTTQ